MQSWKSLHPVNPDSDISLDAEAESRHQKKHLSPFQTRKQRPLHMRQTLVLGIGNTLLSDEGCGIYTINYLYERYPNLPGVRLMDGGTLSFTLLDVIQGVDNLIVVDASQFQAHPGTVRCFVGEKMDRFIRAQRHSVHEVGLSDLLDMARLTESLPHKRALIGIQPAKVTWGDGPTPEVAAALPEAAQQVLDLIEQWRD